MYNTPVKVPVNLFDLGRRINRGLRRCGSESKMLKPHPRSSNYERFGRFYRVDTVGGQVLEHHIEIEVWSREKGFLKPWEVLAE